MDPHHHVLTFALDAIQARQSNISQSTSGVGSSLSVPQQASIGLDKIAQDEGPNSGVDLDGAKSNCSLALAPSSNTYAEPEEEF